MPRYHFSPNFFPADSIPATSWEIHQRIIFFKPKKSLLTIFFVCLGYGMVLLWRFFPEPSYDCPGYVSGVFRYHVLCEKLLAKFLVKEENLQNHTLYYTGKEENLQNHTLYYTGNELFHPATDIALKLFLEYLSHKARGTNNQRINSINYIDLNCFMH